MKALVFDLSALLRLQSGIDFDIQWFEDFDDFPQDKKIRKIEVADFKYFLGPDVDSNSPLLVIATQDTGLFFGLHLKYRPEAFVRTVRAAISILEDGRVPIPTSWSPYRTGSLVSFQSNNRGSGEKARIEIEANPRNTSHIFAYWLENNHRDLQEVNINWSVFDVALNHFEDAAIQRLTLVDEAIDEGFPTHVLANLAETVSLGRSLKDWLSGKLTQEQRKFINKPIEKSIRLVGAAGTGKTLSLVIKCLVDFEQSRNRPSYRVLFLTHSQATVEVVTNAIASLDHEGIISKNKSAVLRICTLQELASDAMKYDLHGLEPLSSDGYDGRVMQVETIESLLEEFRRSTWIRFRSKCNSEFKGQIEKSRGTPEGRSFAFELMNEFACVLDADGVWQSGDHRERYLTEKRKNWMLNLESRDEREVVLVLYSKFRESLRELGVIGVDQMIADYLGYLESNRWDNIRSREGYDVVFVDELHLFNRQERMTLHQLTRDAARPPTVVMAYDSKQSPRDTFYGLAECTNGKTVFSRDMKLGDTERFELDEGFRYTPEIARVLEWIDHTFPAVGISEELGADWTKLALKSTKQSGGKPIVVIAPSTRKIYDVVFPRARRRARELTKGRRVAVLCASEKQFRIYLEAGEHRDLFLPITDREQLSTLRYAGARFIFSMPEYVAGIQFDTVYLIEANEGEVQFGPYATGQLRRYISQIYLGASRAESVLEIYANNERGGTSRCLRHATENGAINVIDLGDLENGK